MEEARVYRDDGAMRILFGLSVVDLIIMAGMFIVLLKVLPLDGLLAIAVAAASAWFGGQAIARGRSHLPVEAIKQYVLWLGQPDVYEPGPDEDARPLVYELEDPEDREPVDVQPPRKPSPAVGLRRKAA